MKFSRMRAICGALVAGLARPLRNDRGEAILFAVVSTLLLMGYYAYDNGLVSSIDGVRQYARDSHEGNPDINRNAYGEALQATVGTLGPSVGAAILAPLSPGSTLLERIAATTGAYMEYQVNDQIMKLVEAGIADPYNVPTGRYPGGSPGNVAPCGITLDPWQAVAPGDFVFITAHFPFIFRQEVSRVYGTAGGTGLFYNLADDGYMASWTVPGSFCSETAVATFSAENTRGETMCSVSVGITIDFSGRPDADGDYLPDSCEDDDDNDGSPDVTDCAPTDPARFPGNEEICGDGLDQDCDGSDLPCDAACSPGSGCCAEFPLVCGGDCWEADSVCCGGLAYVPGIVCCGDNPYDPGAVCCSGGGACPAGRDCCHGGCIPAGTVCCQNGYCDPGESCCGTTCCGSGTYCASPGVCKRL